MDFRLIQNCRGCHAGESAFLKILEMEPMPLAGMFCETAEQAMNAPVFPLTWVICRQCGMVQVMEDVPDSLLYNLYNYASSTVDGLVRHFEEYARFLVAKYLPDHPVAFLEIGCNDGVLLNRLPSAWQLRGVDPSDVAHRFMTNNSGYVLFSCPFTLQFVEKEGLQESQDVISGSNCFAHISDIKDVFLGVHLALKRGGHYWLEVHDLQALLYANQWDTIYHEHKAEWSAEALVRCLLPIGFSHVETHRVPLHGGLLRICFQKETLPSSVEGEVQIEPALAALRLAYQTRHETPTARILRVAQQKGQRIAAYGAAGRANVYLNQMKELRFDYIVDESPLRVNKFILRVAMPVVPREWLLQKPVDFCLITAWNYAEDIRRKNPGFKGQWLTAFNAE